MKRLTVSFIPQLRGGLEARRSKLLALRRSNPQLVIGYVTKITYFRSVANEHNIHSFTDRPIADLPDHRSDRAPLTIIGCGLRNPGAIS